MKISKIRMAAVFSMVIAISLNIIEEYTKERTWFYVQIGVMVLAIILMTLDGKKNKGTVSSKTTKGFVILGVILLLVLIGIVMHCFNIL